jgi:hypothetical protein
VRLIVRTDGQGNSEWCSHSLGTGDIPTNTKFCIKLKRPGLQTCGNIKPTTKARVLQAPFVRCLLLDEAYVQDCSKGSYDLVEAKTLLCDIVLAADDLSTTDWQPSAMNGGVIGRWRSDIQGPMRTPSHIRQPSRQHVAMLDDSSDDDEAPSPISPGFSELAETLSPSLDLEYAVEDSDQRAWQQSLPAGLWDFISSLKTGGEKASHTALRVHRESYSRWITTSKDLHAPSIRLEHTTDTLGSHQTLTGVMASTVWSRSAVVENRKRRGGCGCGYVESQEAPRRSRWT